MACRPTPEGAEAESAVGAEAEAGSRAEAEEGAEAEAGAEVEAAVGAGPELRRRRRLLKLALVPAVYNVCTLQLYDLNYVPW
jgi:hypothetical protein